MPARVKRVLIGDTFKQFWIGSGTTPSVIIASVLRGDESIVSSETGTSSGNGHFYRDVFVNTPGWYVSQWEATISGLPYRRRWRFKAYENEVD